MGLCIANQYIWKSLVACFMLTCRVGRRLVYDFEYGGVPEHRLSIAILKS
jgi:hypothetical protein